MVLVQFASKHERTKHLHRQAPMDQTQKVTIHSVKEPGEIEAELGRIGVLLAGLFTPSGDGWDVLVAADSARIGTLRTLGYQVTTET